MKSIRLILGAACVATLAACSASTPAAPEVAATAEPAAAEPAAMDQTMKSADAADDGSSLVTSDGYTFHTSPGKIEIVRLPQDGTGAWAAHGYAEKDIFRLLDSKDEPVAGGAIHAVRFEMVASGNGKVVFEKRAGENPQDPVTQVISVNFMVH